MKQDTFASNHGNGLIKYSEFINYKKNKKTIGSIS